MSVFIGFYFPSFLQAHPTLWSSISTKLSGLLPLALWTDICRHDAPCHRSQKSNALCFWNPNAHYSFLSTPTPHFRQETLHRNSITYTKFHISQSRLANDLYLFPGFLWISERKTSFGLCWALKF